MQVLRAWRAIGIAPQTLWRPDTGSGRSDGRRDPQLDGELARQLRRRGHRRLDLRPPIRRQLVVGKRCDVPVADPRHADRYAPAGAVGLLTAHYGAIEIERRFLVTETPDGLEHWSSTAIELTLTDGLLLNDGIGLDTIARRAATAAQPMTARGAATPTRPRRIAWALLLRNGHVRELPAQADYRVVIARHPCRRAAARSPQAARRWRG
jgi:hypothetical protein